MGAARLGNALQRRLEALYDLDLPCQVGDFTFSDPALAAALSGTQGSSCEQLLLCEEDGGLAISLYLEPALLAGLDGDPEELALDEASLDALLAVLEGVSHFVYVIWRARSGTACTRLELEMQAEIDKFALLHHFWRERHGQVPASLHARLFEHFRLREEMDAEQQQRYRLANACAARYCHGLQQRFQGRLDHPQARCQLRRFYRAPQAAKLALAGRG